MDKAPPHPFVAVFHLTRSMTQKIGAHRSIARYDNMSGSMT